MMKTLHLLFLLLLTVNFSQADSIVPAEPRKQYDVEIIIFEDAHARYINSESWHKDTAVDNELLLNDIENDNTAKKSKTIVLEKNTESYKAVKPGILNNEYKRINKSSEFNVLLYSAWRQTGLSKAEAFEIDISELNNAHKKKSNNTISGTVKVVLARYLHFYSQLEYQRQKNLAGENETPPNNITGTATKDLTTDGSNSDNLTSSINSYKIQSHRRMRSKELHYIDHPLVGILIRINPVKIKPIEQVQKSGQVNAAQRPYADPIRH